MSRYSYSNHTSDAVPGYKLPLSDHSLTMLGRLMAYWAQIDFFVDELIEHLFGIDHEARRALVGDKVVGTKLALLRKGAARATSEELAKTVSRFVAISTEVQDKRNHAAHGVWAWHIEPGMEQAYLSARKARDLSAELRPEELDDLVSKAAEATRIGLDACNIAHGFRRGVYPVRLFYGAKDVGEEWEPPR